MPRKKKAPMGADFREDPFLENDAPEEPKKKTAAPPEKSEKSGSKPAVTPTKNEDNRVVSVLLFAAGVLIGLIGLIEGTAGWQFMHHFLLGMFGFAAFIVPCILIYASYLIGTEKSRQNITSRAGWAFGLTIMVSSTIQIFFVGKIPGNGIFNSISEVYTSGTHLKSGGVLGMPVAWLLLKVFGGMGAKIVIVLMVFVLFLLLTGKGIVEFMEMLMKPFKFLGQCIDGVHTVIMGGEFEEAFEPEDDEELDEPEIPVSKEEQDFNADLEAIEIVNSKNSGRSVPKPKPILTKEEEEFSKLFDIPLPGQPAAEESVEAAAKEESGNSNVIDSDLDKLINRAAEKKSGHTAEEKEDEAEPKKPVQLPLYILPGLDLLTPPDTRSNSAEAAAEMREKAETIVNTLKSFGVEVKIKNIYRGPSITRYEIQPGAGVKISKIRGLEDDIALSLAAQGVRIEAPVPGKAAVGIEVPNINKDTVTIREILSTADFRTAQSKLAFAVGKDISGNAIIGDIAKMPHVIIAGTTGSGKSVCTRSIIMSILYRAKPEEVKIILIDPKIVEFKVFEGIPHLLIPIVTDAKKAAGALNWAVNEMMRRYNTFADLGANDLKSYNELAEEDDDIPFMPQIVIFIDELADMMLVAGKEVEDSICRLAQMGRAAGMHLVVATQRPTTDVITGLIKANIPSRIALSVMSQVDSRTIIDMAGADKLLGNGDMLYLPIGTSKPVRIQGCFASSKDISATLNFIRSQAEGSYDQEIVDAVDNYVPQTKGSDGGGASESGFEAGSDEDYVFRGAEVAVNAGQLSTTMLQKKLKLGYARASRIMDELEERGIIGPPEGSKPRHVLMSKMQFDEWKLRQTE